MGSGTGQRQRKWEMKNGGKGRKCSAHAKMEVATGFGSRPMDNGNGKWHLAKTKTTGTEYGTLRRIGDNGKK